MLGFLAMLASVLITLLVVGGFIALAAVVVMEVAAMISLWVRNDRKPPTDVPTA